MNPKTFKPSYLFKRIRQWKFQKDFPATPWLTDNAVYILNSWLKKEDEGFEWGSGRSTLWFIKKSAHIVSVEHSEEWFKIVSEKIKAANLQDKVDYHHLPETEEYENFIETFDKKFDYVLIDGKRRMECFRKAVDFVKPGGLLILDNSDRYIPNVFEDTHLSVVNKSDGYQSEEWKEAVSAVSDWRQFQTSDRINDTTFWVKPG